MHLTLIMAMLAGGAVPGQQAPTAPSATASAPTAAASAVPGPVVAARTAELIPILNGGGTLAAIFTPEFWLPCPRRSSAR